MQLKTFRQVVMMKILSPFAVSTRDINDGPILPWMSELPAFKKKKIAVI